MTAKTDPTVDEALPVGAPSRKAYLGLAVLAVTLLVAPVVAGSAGDSDRKSVV